VTARSTGTLVRVDDRQLRLSNLEKVLFPETGFTKSQVIEYYHRIAPTMLPHLNGRPVSLKRFPEGTAAPGFFNKNAPPNTPSWLRTVTLDSPHSTKGHETIRYLVLEEPAALVWTANLAGIELHVPQWRVGPRGARRGADRLVFDLDPGAPAGLAECAQVATLLAEVLADDGLTAYPGLSGGKGMHLYAPLRETPPQRASEYAHGIAKALEQRHPDLVVSQMTKSLRPGRIFIDWSQNNGQKTTIAPYSLRGRARPTIALPLTWSEVEDAALLEHGFEPAEVLELIAERGDVAEPVLHDGPALPTA
jgi:bifunctional non-homologous end joining protein LigD